MRCIRKALFVFACAIPAASCTSSMPAEQSAAADPSIRIDDDGGGDDAVCVHPQRFWRNNPDLWPVDRLELGNHSYTKQQLLELSRTPAGKNGLLWLARQLIAAKLNVANGGSVEINATIDLADRAIGNLRVNTDGKIMLPKSAVSDLFLALSEYNDTAQCAGAPTCGDGHVDDGETCDDGNTSDGDGCSGTCQCDHPVPACGDGHVDDGETCDDGNTSDGDGCSATCSNEPVCGDGHVDEGEQCDDGNTSNDDSCDNECHVCEPKD